MVDGMVFHRSSGPRKICHALLRTSLLNHLIFEDVETISKNPWNQNPSNSIIHVNPWTSINIPIIWANWNALTWNMESTPPAAAAKMSTLAPAPEADWGDVHGNDKRCYIGYTNIEHHYCINKLYIFMSIHFYIHSPICVYMFIDIS